MANQIGGYRRSVADHRDFRFELERGVAVPARSDLRSLMPHVYDQGELGSCTANALAAMVAYLHRKEGKASWDPSRLFIYWNERAAEGTKTQDAGASLRDGMDVLAKLGAPPEALWWYNPVKFAVEPSKIAYNAAVSHRISEYRAVSNSLADVKGCLASGYPVVVGAAVFAEIQSAEVARTGVLPMPRDPKKPLGGHAFVLVGHDDTTRLFLARNSWGLNWGMGGYFTLPYDYIADPDITDELWMAKVSN